MFLFIAASTCFESDARAAAVEWFATQVLDRIHYHFLTDLRDLGPAWNSNILV